MEAGHRVTLAGDGDSLQLLQQHFPQLDTLFLPHLSLEYSIGNSQTCAMLRALPRILRWIRADHRALKQIVQYQHFDRIISDNRFGFFTPDTETIYITHQIMIKMPKGLRWAEGIVHRLHLLFISQFTSCWIPDYADERNLSGDLSHRYPLKKNMRFIGPLSRLAPLAQSKVERKYTEETYDVVAILSGLEPQRTRFEKEIMSRFLHQAEKVLIIQGKVKESRCRIQKDNITLIPSVTDADMVCYLQQAERIIARSGYSTLMDLDALGLLHKAEFHPTPGQTEQEYLALHLRNRNL